MTFTARRMLATEIQKHAATRSSNSGVFCVEASNGSIEPNLSWTEACRKAAEQNSSEHAGQAQQFAVA